MKIGIIGLGDIAQKAYLPVITAKDGLELTLCTRNIDTLNKISKKYRIHSCVQNVEELIGTGIDAAFIHSATDCHVEIAEKLLLNNVHVYVDKPISYSYSDAVKLVELSEKMGKTLMVGFNRRFAPMYKRLKEQGKPDIILIEKNRLYNPDNIRRFIFDDFIHVVDTMRYLIPGDIHEMHIRSLQKEGHLYNITLQLSGKDYTAIGIMNRDSGTTEEIVEYMSPGNKCVVRDMVQTTHFNKGIEKIIKFNDWDSILYRRGFYDIIDHFLYSIEHNEMPSLPVRDSLITHEICEKVANELEAQLKLDGK